MPEIPREPTLAADIARYLIEKYGQMPQLKVQKLLYFCQAASWAWREKPLFPDRIEAWANGPVVVSFWNNHPYEGTITAVPEGKPIMDGYVGRLIDAVYTRFGGYTPEQLSDLTHLEEPWRAARGSLGEGQRGNVPIEDAAMRSYIESWRPGDASAL